MTGLSAAQLDLGGAQPQPRHEGLDVVGIPVAVGAAYLLLAGVGIVHRHRHGRLFRCHARFHASSIHPLGRLFAVVNRSQAFRGRRKVWLSLGGGFLAPKGPPGGGMGH